MDEEQRAEQLSQEEDHTSAERLLGVRPLLPHRVAPAPVHVPVLKVSISLSCVTSVTNIITPGTECHNTKLTPGPR